MESRPRDYTRRDALTAIGTGIAIPSLFGLGGCGSDGDDDDGENGSLSGRSKREIAVLLNNLKQIGVAAHAHAAARGGEFPSDYIDGDKPLLSWRVRLLPYLDEPSLFKQFQTDEPWDSENNKKLVEQMPRILHDPKCPLAGHTPFLFPVGKGTLHDPEQRKQRRGRGFPIDAVSDGLANTVLAVKVDPDLAVPWTKPIDHSFDPSAPFSGFDLIEDSHLALFADGHVARLDSSMPLATQKAIFTPNGKETIRLEDF